MNRIAMTLLMFILPLPIWAADAPMEAPPPRDLAAAIDKLAASVDRVLSVLEKELALRAEDREARWIEIAVAIIGLRYRKIDRLESEVQSASREEEESTRQFGFMKAQVDQLRKQGQTDTGEVSEAAKAELTMAELRVKSEEEHIANRRHRALV